MGAAGGSSNTTGMTMYPSEAAGIYTNSTSNNLTYFVATSFGKLDDINDTKGNPKWVNYQNNRVTAAGWHTLATTSGSVSASGYLFT